MLSSLILFALPLLAVSAQSPDATAQHDPGISSRAPVHATQDDLESARALVEKAISKMTVLNKARLANPARNRYSLNPATSLGKRASAKHENPPPLLTITSDIAAAAALLANEEAANVTSAASSAQGGTFWMEGLSRKGTVPWGDDSVYKVFRNVVTDYKADNTGQVDATEAIQKAINDGKRCGEKCNGSTTKNAIVYFPPGTYKVSSSISVLFGTQIIGDANDWPVIKASKFFIGLGVLSTDVYVPNGGTGPDGKALEWYINTGRFFSQIRNMKIDIRDTRAQSHVSAVHYQVAQATSIHNVELIASTGTTQQGMFAENGSGGVMSDVTFTGGNFGLYGGNQQFSASRLKFNGCNTAAQIIWDWGWVWKSIEVNGADVGFSFTSEADSGSIGSASFIDSVFTDIKSAAIIVQGTDPKVAAGTTGLVLDNVKLGGKIATADGDEVLAAGYYKSWVLGPVYQEYNRTWASGPVEYAREASLLGSKHADLEIAPYFERKRNQYENLSVGDFVHLKDSGAKGDGKSDDTNAVQNTFNKYGDGSKVIFVDSGTYILSDTVTIPKDAKIVGEAWAQFAANGDKFSDAANPRAMLRVGEEGDVGSVEMQDLIITTKGATPGAVLMEWNVKAKDQGSAAMWDVHARLGGATGTGLTPAACPAVPGDVNDDCKAASLMMHITPKASAYFDNVWLWVADHMIDDPDLSSATNDMAQLSVFCARGFLIESQEATWLYGTSSEHSVYYQYNFHNAKNIFTAMVQTESPYYQPQPAPPAPFKDVLGDFPGDPKFSCDKKKFDACDESWAIIMEGSKNIHIGGAGTYSFFDGYSQDCIDKHQCQYALSWINENHSGNRLQHVISIGAQYPLVVDGKAASFIDNIATLEHPSWSQISIYDVPTGSTDPTDEDPCNKDDYSYSDEEMPRGDFYNTLYLNGSNRPGFDDYYITIVNLTPYKFHFASSHACGISPVDFGDVPSGKARQNMVRYSGNTFVDDKAEFYYEIEGTDKKFAVLARTHDEDDHAARTIFDLRGMGLGQREYLNPDQTSSVTLIITGSESFGYISSLTFQPYNWMKHIYHAIKDRQLRHVVMPGSHDAGMSKINNKPWIGGGTAPNTQTQSQSIYNQLRVGSRYFDMRIVGGSDNKYYSAHLSNEAGGGPLFGSLGESLDDMIDDTNKFTNENPGEVIIWWIKYMRDVGTEDGVQKWDDAKYNDFADALGKLDNLCPDLNITDDMRIDQMPMKTYMDQNDGKGCVLLFTEPLFREFNDSSKGIYSPHDIKRDDYWANQDVESSNAKMEVDHMHNQVSRDSGKDDSFFIMQWQLTPNILFSTLFGLDSYAAKEANPALYWYGVNGMSPKFFPTVMLQDYIGQLYTNGPGNNDHAGDFENLGADIQALAIGLNLYMLSQNCAIAPDKNPLYSKKKDSAKIAAASSGDHDPAPVPFTGVIYGNGTMDKNPYAAIYSLEDTAAKKNCSNDS